MTSRFDWLRKANWLYEKMGVDMDKMIPVMEIKTLLLTRSWQAQRQKKVDKKQTKKSNRPVIEKDIGLINWTKTLGNAFLSLFMIAYGFYFTDPGIALSITFLVCFIVQFLGIITDFPLIILDTKDSTNLATKPIDTKTISAAKSTLAMIYMLINSVSLYTFTLVPFMFKGMWSVVGMMIIAIILSNFICVALAYYLYGTVLKFFDGEKLKDILSGFQILLTVLVMIGYQVIVRVMTLLGHDLHMSFQWWHLLVPSYWLTYISTMFYSGSHYSSLLLGCVSLAIIGLILFLHYKVTGRVLEDNLNKMLAEGEKKRGFYQVSLAFHKALAKILFKDNEEAQAFYLFGYSVAGNDRRMKQIIYPLYVSMLITPIVIFFNQLQDNGGKVFDVLANSPMTVLSLYMFAFATGTIVQYTRRSSNPKGSWVYDILPIKSVTNAYLGAALSLLMKFMLPPLVLVNIGTIFLGGWGFLDDLCLINASILLLSVLSMMFDDLDFPFSIELQQNTSRNVMLTVVSIVQPMLFAGLHALLMAFQMPYGLLIAAGLTLVSAIGLFYHITHRKLYKTA